LVAMLLALFGPQEALENYVTHIGGKVGGTL
jgi:hypothetical protein